MKEINNMKTTSVSLALLAGLLMNGAHAADGNINFTGTILDAGCTIDPADVAQTVTLGTISRSAFESVGDVAANTGFSIRLSACPATLTSANARFDGPTHASDNRLLAVTGGATGVGVAIYEADSATLIPIGIRSADVTLTGEAGVLSFVAKYMATADTVVAGPANATSQFTISYN
jgi:major type 1 subunit fimbrin (pilin)